MLFVKRFRFAAAAQVKVRANLALVANAENASIASVACDTEVKRGRCFLVAARLFGHLRHKHFEGRAELCIIWLVAACKYLNCVVQVVAGVEANQLVLLIQPISTQLVL